jgi:septum formation protein
MKRRGLPFAPVLCSDTTVALGKTILGKPDDAKHAAQILGALSGQTHRVLTAVAMGTLSKVGKPLKTEQALSVSNVRFAPLTRTQIQTYVASGEPMGKAGAYAVQGRAAAYIEHISGSYSGIMGLPMFETAQLLREFGFKV